MSRSLWLTLPLLLCAAPLAAQAPAVESVTCLSPCDRVPRPVGQYVHGVELGGRFVTLEDGSVWEVEYSDRATVASWTADDFVRISFISAPRGFYEPNSSTLPRRDFRRPSATPASAGNRAW